MPPRRYHLSGLSIGTGIAALLSATFVIALCVFEAVGHANIIPRELSALLRMAVVVAATAFIGSVGRDSSVGAVTHRFDSVDKRLDTIAARVAALEDLVADHGDHREAEGRRDAARTFTAAGITAPDQARVTRLPAARDN